MLLGGCPAFVSDDYSSDGTDEGAGGDPTGGSGTTAGTSPDPVAGSGPVDPGKPTCTDGQKNGGETDIDCGGPCSKCPDGKTCGSNGDCAGKSCWGGVCQPPPVQMPTCDDKAKNGNESDVDCGGSCPKCPDNRACGQDSDCTSNSCQGNKCEQPSLCSNGKKDPLESDVDCGSLCPTKCGKDKKCVIGNDCQSTKCDKGKCRD